MITVKEMRMRLGLDGTDETDDALIHTLLADAEAYVRAFCRLRAEERVPDFLLSQMVAEDYGKLDGAGVKSRAVSGATEAYLDGYSDSVMRQLYAIRHPGGRRGGSR